MNVIKGEGFFAVFAFLIMTKKLLGKGEENSFFPEKGFPNVFGIKD